MLDDFCWQPSQAGVVPEAFERFKGAYGRRYQAHHREYRKQLVTLDVRLRKLDRKVQGTARMNEIDELGGAVGAELPIRHKSLLARCDPTPLPEEPPEVEDQPIFQRITLQAEAPEKEVADLERQLEDPLRNRLWQLADEAIAAISAKGR